MLRASPLIQLLRLCLPQKLRALEHLRCLIRIHGSQPQHKRTTRQERTKLLRYLDTYICCSALVLKRLETSSQERQYNERMFNRLSSRRPKVQPAKPKHPLFPSFPSTHLTYPPLSFLNDSHTEILQKKHTSRNSHLRIRLTMASHSAVAVAAATTPRTLHSNLSWYTLRNQSTSALSTKNFS